jgi:4-amino-4-deoxy-L-arabinose transferase-like glycosyltransferase
MNARGRVWLAIFLTAVAVRLLTLSAYPLYDTTEARYAEIARVMLATDNWVTPQIEPGEPFWAKPPLSIWATALSFSVLGINEFAARLPSLLFTLATACLILSLRGV